MHGRNVYLEDIPLADAEARLWAALQRAGFLRPTAPESVPIHEAQGRVTAESEGPNRGATFRVWLPCATADDRVDTDRAAGSEIQLS